MAIHRGNNSQKASVSLTKLLDIEEEIWSPKYGIKGKIDATVQARITESGGSSRHVTFPLEIKTGRSTTAPSHRAQTSLYTLLMSDRYGMCVFSTDSSRI